MVSTHRTALAASFLMGGLVLLGAPRARAVEWMGGNLTGNVSLYSDYIFRGVSRSDEHLAPQYGLDYEHSSGVFMSLWGSRVDYEDFGDHEAFMEQDVILGYRQRLDNFSWDMNVTYFWYPKNEASPNLNYWEYQLNGEYSLPVASLSVGALYSPDYFGFAGHACYLSTGVAIPLPISATDLGFTLDAGVGYTKTEKRLFAGDSYYDWHVGLIVEIEGGLSLDLRYHDTDVSGALSDSRFVAGLTYGF